MAAAVPIIKVVGIALSAKAAIDGIKDGNIFQAVIGAVGAYYGLSSLATPATAAGATSVSATAEGAAQGAATAGADTAAQIAAQSAAKGAAESGALETISVGAKQLGGSSITEGMKMASSQAAGQMAANTGIDAINESLQKGADWMKGRIDKVGSALSGGAGESASQGLLSQSMKFANENPFVVQTGLNVVGGVMQGKAEEKLLDRQERLLNERYDRMGSPVDISGATRIKWDPQSRRFVQGVA